MGTAVIPDSTIDSSNSCSISSYDNTMADFIPTHHNSGHLVFPPTPPPSPFRIRSEASALWAEPVPHHSGMDSTINPSPSLWAEPVPHNSGMDSTIYSSPPQTPLTSHTHPPNFSTHTPSSLSLPQFSVSISPISNCPPSPLFTNKSYILNDDNSFALPLIVMNDTYVFP